MAQLAIRKPWNYCTVLRIRSKVKALICFRTRSVIEVDFSVWFVLSLSDGVFVNFGSSLNVVRLVNDHSASSFIWSS